MVDATTRELQAIDYGSQMGGEYLEEIKKYDLERFTKKEWDTLVGVIIGGYVIKLAEIPF